MMTPQVLKVHLFSKFSGLPLARNAPTISISIAIVIVLVGAIILFTIFTPSYPQVKVTFRIDAGPSLTVTTADYSKQTLVSVAGVPKGNITLSFVSGTVGSYGVNVTITYQSVVLSKGSFTGLGNGVYQIQVVYNPRSEETTVPYFIQFDLIQGITIVRTATASVYPR